MKYFLLLLTMLILSSLSSAQSMTYERIDSLLRTECDSVSGGPGAWQLHYRGRVLLFLADESHNRMRIISPIISQNELSHGQLEKALSANFHSVLDAKYALSEGILWSAFLHPLIELSGGQIREALSQVFLAAETFGTTYQSTDLIFPGAQHEELKNENSSPKRQKL